MRTIRLMTTCSWLVLKLIIVVFMRAMFGFFGTESCTIAEVEQQRRNFRVTESVLESAIGGSTCAV